MDDDAIRALVRRLSRANGRGERTVERAAILAAGADFSAIMRWIDAHGGRPEERAAVAPRGGLHGARPIERSAGPAPLRYALPAEALERPQPDEQPDFQTTSPREDP